jgi:large subunit ribosomal protein L10
VNLAEKTEVVEGLRERLGRAKIAIVAQPQGIDVGQITQLRRRMRELEGEYKVAKNTLALRAIDQSGYEPLRGTLIGQTALVFGYGDPMVVAKEIVKYAKDNAGKLEIKAAVLDGQLFEAEQVSELAKLETKEQLRAKLLGVLLAPASQLVRLLNEPGSQLVRAIRARGESGAPAGDAPAAAPKAEAASETPAAEAAAAEAPAAEASSEAGGDSTPESTTN